MKKSRLIGLIIIGLVIMLAGFLSSPLLAQAPADAGGAWEEMHQACASGDRAAMEKAAAEAHGGDFSNMPCAEEDIGGQMNGHMMPGGTY